jgi:hypothetical protein
MDFRLADLVDTTIFQADILCKFRNDQ